MAPTSSGPNDSAVNLVEEEELELQELKDGRFHHENDQRREGGDEEEKDGIEDEEEVGMQQFQLFSPEEERKVRRRLDRRVVLFIAFLYLLSFLDRSSTSRLSIQQEKVQLT